MWSNRQNGNIERCWKVPTLRILLKQVYLRAPLCEIHMYASLRATGEKIFKKYWWKSNDILTSEILLKVHTTEEKRNNLNTVTKQHPQKNFFLL